MRIYSVAILTLAWTACGVGRAPVERPQDPLRAVSAQELFQRGQTLLQSADYIRAEQYLHGAMKRGYPVQRVLPSILAACTRGGRYQAALGHAESVLARDESDWRLRYLVATLHYSLGNHDEAAGHLSRVTHESSEFADAFYTWGLTLVAQGKAQAGKEAFAKYLALAPQGLHSADARTRVRLAQPPRTTANYRRRRSRKRPRRVVP